MILAGGESERDKPLNREEIFENLLLCTGERVRASGSSAVL